MRGSVFVEVLVGFPFLLIIFLFLVQLSLLWVGKMLISYSAYSAVRIASVHPSNLSKVEDYVRKVFSLWGGSFVVEFYKEEGGRVDELRAGDKFTVVIRWDFKLSVPIVNAVIGRKGIGYRYLPLKEFRKGVVEKCPGWERGECVE